MKKGLSLILFYIGGLKYFVARIELTGVLHKRKKDDNRNKSLVTINDQCPSPIQTALIKFDGIGGEKGLNFMCWGFPKFGSLYFDRPLTSNLLNLNNEKNPLEQPTSETFSLFYKFRGKKKKTNVGVFPFIFFTF